MDQDEPGSTIAHRLGVIAVLEVFLALFRLLRTAITANLLISGLVILAYALYGQVTGLPVHEEFLGTPQEIEGVPASTIQLLLITFIWAWSFLARRVEPTTTKHRLFCGLMGLFGLFAIFRPVLQIFPPYTDEGDILPRPTVDSVVTFDTILGIYLYCSWILYAIVGSNKLEEKPVELSGFPP